MQLPIEFIRSLRGVEGFDEPEFIAVHEDGGQVVSVRLNPSKPAVPSFQLAEKIPWSSHGYYIKERPSFTLDPLLHAGAYYVQEASSMFLEHIIRKTCDVQKPLNVLDLCAAPGGKSTLIQSIISSESVLVSNEIIKQRAGVLEENITKWGAANVIITCNEPKDFTRLEGLFDLVVVDAPCSGSGLFRKDPDAISHWSLNNVAMCSQRQKDILACIIPCLKENGILIYSTCSYSREENENISKWLLSTDQFESMEALTPSEWNIVTTNDPACGFRFYPDKLKGEGFFIAAFRKISLQTRNSSKQKRTAPITKKDFLLPWIGNTEELKFISHKNSVIALPENTLSMLQQLTGLYILKAGINVGVEIRNQLLPSHELALSTIVNTGIDNTELDKENALQYLRRAEMNLSVSQKGWIIVKYNTLNLGFIKAMGNRVNNYYPKEWRIVNR